MKQIGSRDIIKLRALTVLCKKARTDLQQLFILFQKAQHFLLPILQKALAVLNPTPSQNLPQL